MGHKCLDANLEQKRLDLGGDQLVVGLVAEECVGHSVRANICLTWNASLAHFLLSASDCKKCDNSILRFKQLLGFSCFYKKNIITCEFVFMN